MRCCDGDGDVVMAVVVEERRGGGGVCRERHLEQRRKRLGGTQGFSVGRLAARATSGPMDQGKNTMLHSRKRAGMLRVSSELPAAATKSKVAARHQKLNRQAMHHHHRPPLLPARSSRVTGVPCLPVPVVVAQLPPRPRALYCGVITARVAADLAMASARTTRPRRR